MKIHFRIHTNEKRFVCELCNKRFSEKCTLNKHLVRHAGEKSFICATCGKGFCDKSGLTTHLITHTRLLFVSIVKKDFVVRVV